MKMKPPSGPKKQTQKNPISNRKAEAKNGTFLAVRPTYIIELCERAGTRYIMSCLF